MEYGGCLMVGNSQSIWMDWMSWSIWNCPSIVPITATCQWTSVRGGRDVFGDRCRMWTVGCVPTVRLEELRCGGIVRVVVGDLVHGVVLLDVVGKLSGEWWIVRVLVVEVLVVE